MTGNAEIAGLDIEGLDNEGLEIDGLDNGGLEIDGLDIAKSSVIVQSCNFSFPVGACRWAVGAHVRCVGYQPPPDPTEFNPCAVGETYVRRSGGSNGPKGRCPDATVKCY